MATGTELAKAYVQIIPSARGIKEMLEKELGGELPAAGKEGGKKFGSGLLSGIAGIGRAAAAALGAATTAVGVLAKTSLDSYGEYEQLVGGAQLMFGDAFAFVSERAAQAYANVQMSQNEYLQQVNGFATGLKTALGGDELAAARLADRIVTAEADIVAATGNTSEAVQNAFNGIMRSNYTMLDNLQLGITPTKEGFQQLIDQVNAWNAENGRATEYTIDNLADAQSALLDYVEMQGLAEYAGMEAAETIQGSVASMAAAWKNLVVGIADGDADLTALVGGFVGSVETAAGRVLPRVGQIFSGIGNVIQTALPALFEKVPEALGKLAPGLLSSGMQLVTTLAQGFVDAWPELQAAGSQLFGQLVLALQENLPTMIEQGLQALLGFSGGLREGAGQLVDAAITLIQTLADGLIAALPALFENVPTIVSNIAGIINDNAPRLLETAASLIWQLVVGLIQNIPVILANLPQILLAIADTINAFNWINLGSTIMRHLGSGIANMAGSIKATVQNVMLHGISYLKSLPEQALKWGADMIQGLINGILGKAQAVIGAVSSIANKIASLIHFSRPDAGPLKHYDQWMPDFMAGLAGGISANAWRVRDAIMALAGDMGLELAPRLQMPSLQAAAASGGAVGLGGSTTNLYQTIYTHDSLSESELTREGEDMLERSKWRLP